MEMYPVPVVKVALISQNCQNFLSRNFVGKVPVGRHGGTRFIVQFMQIKACLKLTNSVICGDCSKGRQALLSPDFSLLLEIIQKPSTFYDPAMAIHKESSVDTWILYYSYQ